jgi:methylenetetrahydrofolate reductase (NADPH)
MSSESIYSFEFFPPRTPEGATKLTAVWRELARLKPRFFSVTFGAGGSTRDGTLTTVERLCADGLEVAPHLSCIGAPRESVNELLERYRSMGIRRIVALRGDLPSGSGLAPRGQWRYASDLVAHIRATTGDWFHIEVAAYPETHPQARSPQADVEALVEKARVGANSAITQFFFNADAYFRCVDEVRSRGVQIPIVPGIMPITNYMQLRGFAERSAIDMPRWIELRLASYGDDIASIRAFGLDVVTQLCERLIAQGVPGLHFYTMNQAQACAEIWKRLGI